MTGYVPGVTLDATLSASVDVSVVPVSVAGVNTPVIPVGGLTRESATSVVKFVRTIATEVLPLAPAWRLKAVGVAEMVKFPAAVTVTVTVASCVTEPAVPRTVTGYEPAATFEATVSASCEVRVVPVSVAGVKTPVIPAGGLTSDSATSVVKFVRTIATEVLPLAPAARFKVVGVAEMVKLPAGAGTVTFTVVFCVTDPAVPRTVTGYVPAATFAATVSASVEVSVVPVSVAGVKTPVIPVGGLTSESATSVVKFVRTIATEVLPLAPAARFKAAGVAEIVKFPVVGAVTVSAIVVVLSGFGSGPWPLTVSV